MATNAVDEDGLRKLGKNLLTFIGSALIIKPEKNTPEDVVASGTFSYVDTGDQTLLVTCDHVFAEFNTLREKDDKIEFCWGAGPGRTPQQLTHCVPTDRNSHIDICTFTCEIPGGLDQIGKAFFRPESWPPARVEEGDLVIGIGFPGEHRGMETKNGQVGLALVASFVSGQVSTVSDRHFTVADEACERWSVQLSDKSFDTAWGGMSGGVFFKVLGANEYKLAGFMKEGGSKLVLDTEGSLCDGEDAPREINATLFVSHADFILASGKLDYGLIPY